MLQCDEDEETKTIESGDKCFASEDKSNADVSKATDASNLKELLLLRNGILPVLHDGENNNSGESTGLGANCGDEGDINNPSFWNSVLNDRSCNSSISTQTADEQSFLVSSSSHGGSGLQDVRELSENQGESAENPPETTETSEDSADIVDISDENKNLAYKEGDAKKTRQFNLPYEGIRNSQIQRYSNCIEYSSSYIGSGSCDSEKLQRSSPYEGEMVTHIADETCCEETGFGNEDLVLAETNQQLPKGSSGLARGMLVEDEEAFSLVSGRSGISVESSSESHNLSADIEKNAMKMNRERKLSEKDEGREGKDVISTNGTVDGLKKPLNDVEEQSTERDNIAQMDDLCQKQIENLTLRQSGGSSSSLSELQTLNAGARNECSDVKCEKVLDSKACFSTEVVQELNEPEKEALFSDCGEDKRLDTDALMMVIGPDFEGASLDDATERDLDRSLPVPVGKTIACHLPSLEDGLSSGHASDSDEMAASRQAEGPGDGLSLPQKTEVQSRPALLASSQLSRGTVEGIHASVDPVSEARKKDVLHLAIQDIKSAIEKSKTVKLISPSVGDEEQPKEADEYRSVEPVWITRKEQAKDLQRQTPKNQNKPSTSPPETANSHKTSKSKSAGKEYSTDDETDELLNKQYVQSAKLDIPELSTSHANQSQDERQKSRVREVALRDPTNEAVLIEGVLFRASYLGSTQLVSEGQPSKRMRTAQAQEAVNRIKAPEGETQPSTEVDLFVSAEKIMVLNTDLQEIMMDHALRTISYIADIGEILVVMARRSPTVASASDKSSAQRRSQTKLCCHVFESDEAQLIAQSIGRAFHASYVEFLKANGIDNPSHIQDLDYQEVLNQQEIFSEELSLFSNREMQKEVTVSKAKGEPLGVVIVESGWGSLLPTVVLANMSPVGAAARCGQLNIGDQIMSIDGVSLVGLPLTTCQSHIKSVRNQLVVKLVVVSCPPVVEVLIKRPDVKYQLGFSVQDGVICSLLRGGIAERGGVRVGHRIIEINGRSVVAISHETIVELLAASVGEIQMRTMPTSIFQLLTGQDVPHYI